MAEPTDQTMRRKATQPEMPKRAEDSVKEQKPPEERLLQEQELSAERQREGHGWAGLSPGESSGTTPVPPAPTEAAERSRHTPSAAAAEQEGEPRRPEARKERSRP
jgi:hypothetical protein